MTLILISRPHWFRGNDRSTKWNPDVFGPDAPPLTGRRPFVVRLTRVTLFGKSPVKAYLRFNKYLWDKLPPTLINHPWVRGYGRWLHTLALWRGGRSQALATFFFRNRPQLELIRRLVAQRARSATLKVLVLGCSTGAEAYSVSWHIKSARPDLELGLGAMDISEEAVAFAKRGIYSSTTSDITRTSLLERLSPSELQELFDRNEQGMSVKQWIREGLSWGVGDAGDPNLVTRFCSQDIVIANNFLCHMEAADAERCLRNIARLVKPGGYLFVSGIDLEIRTRVANGLGWQPVAELLEEIHDGDPCVRQHWPFDYAGLEPLDRGRPDWRTRYATAFRLGV
jgi:SAM-dependent methyltransferase